MITITETTQELIEVFVCNPIRPIDITEWTFHTSLPIDTLLTNSLKYSVMSRCALNSKGVPQVIWGVVIFPEELEASVWMIAAEGAERYGFAIQRYAKDEVQRMHLVSDTLTAVVYPRNELHVKWLNILGFEDKGDAGFVEDFKLYVKENKPCATPCS